MNNINSSNYKIHINTPDSIKEKLNQQKKKIEGKSKKNINRIAIKNLLNGKVLPWGKFPEYSFK